MRRLLINVLAALILVVPATAQDMVAENDIDAILAKAQETGEASIQEADVPLIRAEVAGHAYGIVFPDCAAPEGCRDFMFQTNLLNPVHDPELANSWNRLSRWTKVYYDEDGDIALEMDVDLTGGISQANLNRAFSIWIEAVGALGGFFAAP